MGFGPGSKTKQANRWYVGNLPKDRKNDLIAENLGTRGEGFCRARYDEILMLWFVRKAQAYWCSEGPERR